MKPKKSIVLAACAIKNIGDIHASATTTNSINSIHKPAFLIRGGSTGGEASANVDGIRGGNGGSTSAGSSKRKKKKKRKNKNDKGQEEDLARSQAPPGNASMENGKAEKFNNKKGAKAKLNDYKRKSQEKTSAKSSAKIPKNPPRGEKDASSTSSARKNPATSPKQSQPKSQPTPQPKPETKPKTESKDHLIEEIIKSDDLYQILSLNKSEKSTLTSIQITKAYRRRALLTHPDKLNGDRRAFDKISEAYEILSDESKKKIYDKYGLEAVKDPDFAARASGGAFGGMGMGGSFQDQILRSFFGATSSGASSGFSRMSQQFRKNQDVKYELEVSLEDMYRGAHRQIRVPQPKGSSSGPKMVDLDIPAGVVPGSSIRLSGMVDHVTHATPGDIIFIVRQRQHEKFTRKGHDLAMEVKISLSESICGFERKVVHLDGREFHISSPVKRSTRGDIPVAIKTGDVHVLKGEGMPRRNQIENTNPWMDIEDGKEDTEERCERFGDLYVQYTVEMPAANDSHLENLSEEERDTLGALLDKLQGYERTSSSSRTDSVETSPLRQAQASDFGRASGIAEPQNDGEDEHMHDDEDEHFGSNGFQYYSSSGGRRSHHFFSGGSPFTSSSRYGSHDEGDVQCQQM